MGLAVSILILIARHVARLVRVVPSPRRALAAPLAVKALAVAAGEAPGVRQAPHRAPPRRALAGGTRKKTLEPP